MKDDLKLLKKKYITLNQMNIVSKNGCSKDDYLYSSFLLGQAQILKSILNDLNELIKKYDIRQKVGFMFDKLRK